MFKFVTRCENGVNECHLHIHFHGCTQVKSYIFPSTSVLTILPTGKRKYWRWVHQTVWALAIGRGEQYCHGFPSGQVIKLTTNFSQLTLFCRLSRTGCRGILAAVGTSGATWGTRRAISTPPRRVTSCQQWRGSWRKWRISPCFDNKM